MERPIHFYTNHYYLFIYAGCVAAAVAGSVAAADAGSVAAVVAAVVACVVCAVESVAAVASSAPEDDAVLPVLDVDAVVLSVEFVRSVESVVLVCVVI